MGSNKDFTVTDSEKLILAINCTLFVIIYFFYYLYKKSIYTIMITYLIPNIGTYKTA